MRRLASAAGWCSGFCVGPAWMRLARRRVRRAAVLDDAAWRARLGPYFGRDLIDAVTVRVVGEVRPPGAALARRVGAGVVSPAGLCLGDTVVIRRDVAESPRVLSVLFHELVHVAQMRRMGKARFCGAYLAGWVEAGYSYRAIPLEVEAYALQERFERGEVFVVGEALDGVGPAWPVAGP